MSTLVEIESAAKQFPESDRQRLLISLMQSLRLTDQALPPSRLFSVEEMQGWMRMKRTLKHSVSFPWITVFSASKDRPVFFTTTA